MQRGQLPAGCSAAIYFPLFFYCKTNASALELLTEIIRPSHASSRIFSQPYAVLNVRTCMEKVNGNISIFFLFLLTYLVFSGLRLKGNKTSLQL